MDRFRLRWRRQRASTGPHTAQGTTTSRVTLDRTGRHMGYVSPGWISPVVREYFPYHRWPRLSPYFEHREYSVFVAAQPYEELATDPTEAKLYERGLIWAKCYSTSCVLGEHGHHSLASLWPITPERFRAAEAVGWNA